VELHGAPCYYQACNYVKVISARFLTVAGRHVRVFTRGTGTPAVFFDTALGTPAEEWDLVAAGLPGGARVILWDRPGTGRSEGPVLGPDEFPDAAAELLGQLDARPVVAVGHSMGGLNVLCLALSHPELVAGAVFVDPSHPDQDQRMPSYEGQSGRVKDWFMRLSERVGQPPGWITGPVGSGLSIVATGMAPLLARYSGNHGGLLPPSTSGVRLMAAMAPVVAANVRSFAAEARTYAPQLETARHLLATRVFPPIPLVVLTGQQTQADENRAHIWDDMHEGLARLSPHGRHIRLDCGHAIPFTNAADVVAAISQVRSEARCTPS
jgi:pimeloyl-ACP methyl ester carboxylesterase